jgi:DNA-binding transcriptional LysR family regulator
MRLGDQVERQAGVDHWTKCEARDEVEVGRSVPGDGPAYLARLGEPRSPDLAEAELVGFDTTDRMLDGLNALWLRLTRRNFPIVTANHLVHLELARSGVAIGVFPESVAAKDPVLVPADGVLAGLPVSAEPRRLWRARSSA